MCSSSSSSSWCACCRQVCLPQVPLQTFQPGLAINRERQAPAGASAAARCTYQAQRSSAQRPHQGLPNKPAAPLWMGGVPATVPLAWRSAPSPPPTTTTTTSTHPPPAPPTHHQAGSFELTTPHPVHRRRLRVAGREVYSGVDELGIGKGRREAWEHVGGSNTGYYDK